MLRRRHSGVAALVGGVIFVAVAALNASGAPPDNTADDRCLGLACTESDQDVPEARGPVTSVSGPGQLKQQRQAGFYEYGLRNPEYGKRAVGYVVPPGQANRMPASVRDLPMVRSLAEAGSFEDGSTVFIVDDQIFGAIPPATRSARATQARAARRPRARTAHVENNCPEYHFCIYDFQNNTGERWGLYGNGTGWISLNVCCGFSDRAESAHNNRNNDSLLNRNNPPTNGSNDRYCSDSNSVDFDLDNNFGGNGRNVASSWANTPDNIHC